MHMQRPTLGFSLVELMVALAVTGILMGGMAKVFGATLSNLHASGNLTNAQRRNRWMMDRLSDDLKMAGHTDGLSGALDNLQEPPFLIIPGGTEAQPLDALQLFSNQPLQEGSLTAAIASTANTFTVTPDGANELHVQKGDWFFLKDGKDSEVGFVEEVDGTKVTMMTSSQIQALPNFQIMEVGSGFMNASHPAGARVAFLRPFQLVRYSIQEQTVDPADVSVKVPCLVRQETVYQNAAVDWTKVPTSILAVQAHALRVDISPDAGRTWTRAGAKDWATIKTAANAQLSAANPINDSELWFKRVPLIVRVDLTARTTTARTEYAAKPTEVAYGLRTQTLVVTPRNFAIPL